jgi:hypothetical protein
MHLELFDSKALDFTHKKHKVGQCNTQKMKKKTLHMLQAVRALDFTQKRQKGVRWVQRLVDGKKRYARLELWELLILNIKNIKKGGAGVCKM